MRKWLVACLAVQFACGLMAAAAAQTPPAKILRIGMRSDADTLDATLARTFAGRLVFAGLCDKLFDIDEKLTIQPQLATGYQWADPKTLILHLRPGVMFHDGEMMDAAAVKYSLDRHLQMPGSSRRAELSEVDHVEIVDPMTVRVVLHHASSPFLAQLTDRAGMIVAPKAAEQEGKDFGLHPVCAGPFRFTDRVAQDHITLDRFPEYWNAAAIHLDRVVFMAMPDSSVRLTNLQSGAIDISEQIVPTDAKAVQSDSRLRLIVSDALGYYGITTNISNGPRSKGAFGQSALVRQAFELSIDRLALLQVVYNGMVPPTAQAVTSNSPYYVPSVQPPARDVAKAKALLRQAGVQTPFPVELLVTNSPDIVQVGEVIQSMAAEAGFAVKLRAIEAAAEITAMSSGDFEAAIQNWSGRPDPDGNLYTLLHTGGPQNDGHYSSPVVDSLLDEARQASDVTERREFYRKLWAQETQDLAIIYLWSWRNIAGVSTKITGFVPVADGLIRFQGLDIGN